MDTLTTDVRPREQSRARYPDRAGFVERDGVRIFWEAYGSGDQTVLLLPDWEIVHSRIWKGQIPYLARRFRVVTFDPRGNGRSDRPPQACAPTTGSSSSMTRSPSWTPRTAGPGRGGVVVAPSIGLMLAAAHPERVAALVDIASDLPVGPGLARVSLAARSTTNCPPMRAGPRGTVTTGCGTGRASRSGSSPRRSPSRTRPSRSRTRSAGRWRRPGDDDPRRGVARPDQEQALELCGRVRCPVLVIRGRADGIVGAARGPAIAAAIPGARC